MTGILVAGLEAVMVRHLADQKRAGFPHTAFTPAEWRLFHARPQSLAGRLAAKSAVAAALGMDLADATSQGIAPTEIEVLSRPSGQPQMRLSGNASARAVALGLSRWFVSISHTRELAVAFVVGCREGESPGAFAALHKDPP